MVDRLQARAERHEITEIRESDNEYRRSFIVKHAFLGSITCLSISLLVFIAYFRTPIWPLLLIANAFLLTGILHWWCSYRIRTKGYSIGPLRLTLGSVLALTFISMWLTTERLVQPAAMVLILLAFQCTCCESPRGTLGWVIAASITFAASMFLRYLILPPPQQLGFVEPLMFYTFPITVIVLGGLFGHLIVRHLQQALNKTQDSLQALHESYASVEQQVSDRTCELERAYETLRTYTTQAEELAAATERNRIAREIHDSLGHHLTAITSQLKGARAVFETDPASTREMVEGAYRSAQDALRDTQRSVATLRESLVGQHRLLSEALNELIVENRLVGIRVALTQVGDPRALLPPTTFALYRSMQEALTNVRKHAAMAHVIVQVDYSSLSYVRLVVQDDGPGIDGPPNAIASGGYGLIGIRERIEDLNGTVDIHTAPGQGFRLEIEVPG